MACRFDVAREAFSKGEAEAEQAGPMGTETARECRYQVLGAAWFGSTPVAEGIRLSRALLDRKVGDLTDESLALAIHGQFLALSGEFDPARRLMDESLQLCRDLGIWLGVNECYEARGRIEALAGELASAERWIRQSLEGQLERGEHGHASTTGLRLAQVLIDRGRLEEADDQIKQCEDLSASDDVLDLGLAATGRARIRATRGDGPAALAEARRAVSIFESTQMPREHGDALLALADALLLTGDRVGARSAAARALELYEQKGALVLATRARQLLERVEQTP